METHRAGIEPHLAECVQRNLNENQLKQFTNALSESCNETKIASNRATMVCKYSILALLLFPLIAG